MANSAISNRSNTKSGKSGYEYIYLRINYYKYSIKVKEISRSFSESLRNKRPLNFFSWMRRHANNSHSYLSILYWYYQINCTLFRKMSNNVSLPREIRVEVSPAIEASNALGAETSAESESMAARRIPPVYSQPSHAGYFRPWRFTHAEKSGTSRICYSKTTKFRVKQTSARFSFFFPLKFWMKNKNLVSLLDFSR